MAKKPKKPEDLLQQVKELEEKLKRSLADYVNLEKRIESQKQMYALLAATAVISKMIEALDDFYLAQSHLKDKGLEIAINKFVSALKSEGVEEIKAVGETFDPQLMDCVGVAPGPQDRVVNVNKKGYLLNGSVLRPAQVTVGTEEKKESNSS